MPDDDRNFDRREFLNWSWKILGVGLAVEAAWTTYDILAPQRSGAFGGTVVAGPVNEFPEGTVRYYLDGRFYVTSYEGSLYALYQKCPHLGCRVPFCGGSGQFECPCHGSVFNIKGEYLDGPAPRGMDRFPIRVEGDSVVVNTGSTEEGPAKGILTGPSEPSGPSCLGDEGAGPADTGGLGSMAETGDVGGTGQTPEATP
jgi:cytochrome b6-f complex iron-sulfur subunit